MALDFDFEILDDPIFTTMRRAGMGKVRITGVYLPEIEITRASDDDIFSLQGWEEVHDHPLDDLLEVRAKRPSAVQSVLALDFWRTPLQTIFDFKPFRRLDMNGDGLVITCWFTERPSPDAMEPIRPAVMELMAGLREIARQDGLINH